jgi:hypothetical protein
MPKVGGAPGVASAASQAPVVQCAPAPKPALDLLSRSDVLAAIDDAWLQSFGHPPFHAATMVDDMGMPTNPNYRGNRYEGVEFRETYFYTDADGKPTPIQVSPLPLDIIGATTPNGATAAFHTHPDQKRANPSETGSASIDFVLTVDEQAARQGKIPVYIIGQKTIREIYYDGRELKTQVFPRRALERQSAGSTGHST